MEVWNLYRQSQTYGQKPSEGFGIRGNRWLAYQFDNAVVTFGQWVEGKLSERDRDNKPKHKIEDLLKLKRKPKPVSRAALEGVWGIQVKDG